MIRKRRLSDPSIVSSELSGQTTRTAPWSGSKTIVHQDVIENAALAPVPCCWKIYALRWQNSVIGEPNAVDLRKQPGSLRPRNVGMPSEPIGRMLLVAVGEVCYDRQPILVQSECLLGQKVDGPMLIGRVIER